MSKHQYGLKASHPYPTEKDECGCVRIVMEKKDGHVIDYCQRHVLNEILHALRGISSSILAPRDEDET